MQKEKLSSLIFDHIYEYLESKDKSFSTYGINGPETLLIQELIDHDLRDRVMVQPHRQFLYEVCFKIIMILMAQCILTLFYYYR